MHFSINRNSNKAMSDSIRLAIAVMSITLACYTTNIFANEKHSGELQGWSFSIEQDLFYLINPDKNEDRDYTIGIDVGLFGEKATHSYLHDGLIAIDSLFGLKGVNQLENYQRSMHLGVAVYTPDDLSNPNPVYDDRPYASLLYWSNRINRIAADQKSGIATELTLGVLGLGIAGEIQALTHKIQREISGSDTPEAPQGWDHQISDGGELTFRYRLEYKHLLTQDSWYDLSTAVIGNLGYQTDLGAGILLRAGNRASHFAFFEPRPAQQTSQFEHAKPTQDNYIYLYYQITGVAYNELLQGGFRESAVTLSADQIERVVHSLALGWTMTLKSGTRLTFAQYMHSPEFKGSNSRNHYWGGFYLTFPLNSQ